MFTDTNDMFNFIRINICIQHYALHSLSMMNQDSIGGKTCLILM